ncbi:MAG: trimethylamine methyltransferase family protein, partial [Candidatus Bathyarchaeia archaeon]
GGLLATATMSSLVKMVIDDEIIGMVKYALRGIEITKDKIPMDLIHEIGPLGNFMGNRKVLEFTRKYLRTEHYVPNPSLRVDRDLCTKEGKKTVLDVAREKLDKILKAHEPVPLPADVIKDLKRVYNEAKKKLAHRSSRRLNS